MELSKQETKVVQLLADGRLQKQAAGDLGLAEATVQSHVVNARRRNKIPTTVALIASALRQGLIK